MCSRATRRSAALALALGAALGGCAARAPSPAESLQAPVDFSLDVSVAAGPGADRVAALAPLEGRYVLFADGSLHGSAAPGRDAGWLPERTRALARAHVEAIWKLCREGGLADPGAADPLVDPASLAPGPGEIVCSVVLSGAGRRWNFVRRGEASEPIVVGAPIRALVEQLVALAWLDERGPRAIVPPRRYDFGPDPYERYRN